MNFFLSPKLDNFFNKMGNFLVIDYRHNVIYKDGVTNSFDSF